jgi:glutamate-1-semialdehyde 2,1-aminomutase
MSIHTVDGPVTSPRDLAATDPELKQLLFHELVDRGCYLAARGYIALSAAITDADCDAFVIAVTDAVATIERL